MQLDGALAALALDSATKRDPAVGNVAESFCSKTQDTHHVVHLAALVKGGGSVSQSLESGLCLCHLLDWMYACKLVIHLLLELEDLTDKLSCKLPNLSQSRYASPDYHMLPFGL